MQFCKNASAIIETNSLSAISGGERGSVYSKNIIVIETSTIAKYIIIWAESNYN